MVDVESAGNNETRQEVPLGQCLSPAVTAPVGSHMGREYPCTTVSVTTFQAVTKKPVSMFPSETRSFAISFAH